MTNFRCAVVFVGFVPLAVMSCQTVTTDPSSLVAGPLLSDLGDNWSPIEVSGDTTCSDGTDFRFFVRVADPQALVVYFQGGGACWTGATCDLDGDPTYKPLAEDELRSASGTEVEDGTMHGMMAFGHPENPFANHSVVFVPYCTGDVHLGDAVTTYPVEGTTDTAPRDVTVHHRGYVNAMTTLNWTYEQFLAPNSIFVTGSSGGAIPSPLYARFLTDHYPDARVAVLGDGAGGYRNLLDGGLPHEAWGTLEALSDLPEFANMNPKEFTFESLYITSGQRHPNISFGRYDTAEDVTQRQFLGLGGVNVDQLQPLIDANDTDIRTRLNNYASYVAPGELHTILLRPEFYTYQVNGVGVRDWVTDLAGGVMVDDVHCGTCDELPRTDNTSR